MSENPEELKYVETHEWVREDDNGSVLVGITDYAQGALGDVVYVELPEVDSEVEMGDEVAVVESVKAASDIYAPLSGTITEVNESLEGNPELVNTDPYRDGWFFRLKLRDVEELSSLMDSESYSELCDNEGQQRSPQ